MRFSIVVPIYNKQDYLKEMTESLEKQGFSDYELILADDGSTDKSAQLCDEYAAGNEKVKVIHKKNAGAFSARVEGENAASGEYILFLDADDMYESGALQKIDNVIRQTSCDMVIFNAQMYEKGIRSRFFEHEFAPGLLPDKKELYDKLFFSYSMNSMCIKAIKKELFTEEDLSDYYDCRVAEDLLQSVPLYVRAKSIYYLDECLYDYRVTQGATHRYNPQFFRDNKKISRKIRTFFDGEQIEDYKEKSAFHILIAAYAATTQMKYSSKFEKSDLEDIASDEEFTGSYELIAKSRYKDRLSKKQKLILKLLYTKNWTMIKLLLKIRGGN